MQLLKRSSWFDRESLPYLAESRKSSRLSWHIAPPRSVVNDHDGSNLVVAIDLNPTGRRRRFHSTVARGSRMVRSLDNSIRAVHPWGTVSVVPVSWL